jgi:hypothetical protein
MEGKAIMYIDQKIMAVSKKPDLFYWFPITRTVSQQH